MKLLTHKVPRLHIYVITALTVFIVIQSILRFVFLLKFNNPADPLTTDDMLRAFYLGMKFDLQASLGTLLPVILLGWIKPLHPVYSKLGRRLWNSYISFAFIIMYLVYITDAGHYAYLQQRINATALRFLENPLISATMVWETYPVVIGSFIFILTVAATIYLFLKLSSKIDTSDTLRLYWKQKRWYKKTVLVIFTVIIVFSGLMAKISWYPLRWSDAFFSTHSFSSQLASNPVIYFSNTLKNIVESYDLDATRQAYPTMVDYLQIAKPDINKLNYSRQSTFEKSESRQTNIIVVFLESFASYKTSLSGNPLNPTPNFARIAGDGYYFKNFFTPSTGTARSVWTFVTGLPDIEKNKTSTRNPLIVDQHTIINAYKDHKKFYFLGGSASWANIRGLLASNLPDLKLYEEGSYDSKVIDVWGISDLSLFREANAVLKNSTQPFFAVIQTSGNHRPYTIPDDNEGFKILTKEDLPGNMKNYGFASLEELNSFRFMDHSVGHFMELASKEAYFDNTLFVFFGDHGIHAPTGKHIPKYETQLNLQGLRVPLVFYGKSLITEAKVFNKIAGEVDILPSIAALTKTSNKNTTLGRNLFDTSFDDERYAFTIEHGSNRTIGLLSDEYYLQMHADGSNKILHQLHSKNPRNDVSAKHEGITRKFTNILKSMWVTIKYMRENNKPDNDEQPSSTITQN